MLWLCVSAETSDNAVVANDASRRVRNADYDSDPSRFRLARSVLEQHARAADIHAEVAERFLAEELTPVLDVGCGEGELSKHLPDGAWVGVDNSPTMLARAPKPNVLAEATDLPFEDESYGAVALLYVLYHLEDPRQALAEARRLLRRGGLLAVAAPSRHDSPELAHALPSEPLTFDAELAPQLLAEQFTAVEAERWDAPLLELPTRDAVHDYLIGKGAAPAAAQAAADQADLPLAVTKRGAVVFARKP
jgi:SAM-dependent methyltransferase